MMNRSVLRDQFIHVAMSGFNSKQRSSLSVRRRKKNRGALLQINSHERSFDCINHRIYTS